MPAPRRIASLLASATEILYGLGLGDRVVAVSHECDWPAEVKQKPRATRSRIDSSLPSGEIDRQVRELMRQGVPLYEVDGELLASLAPELIVTQAQCDVCSVRLADVLRLVGEHPALRGTPVVSLNPSRLDDILIDILEVGRAAGCEERAHDWEQHLRRRIAAVREPCLELPPHAWPSVAIIEWIEPLMVAANWMPELVELAGGTHELTVAGQHSTITPWDDVVQYDPQVLIVSSCGFDLQRTVKEAAVLPKLPGWKDISAVRHGRVYAVDGNAYLNRSGPRTVDSLELLAYLLHPEIHPVPRWAAKRSPAWQPL